MEKEKKEALNPKPKCNRCGSRFNYIRIKDKFLVCRSCGNIQKLEGEENA